MLMSTKIGTTPKLFVGDNLYTGH